MTDTPGSDAGRRIAKNTGLMFGGKGTGAVLNVLVLVVVGRSLSPTVFGSLLIIHATMLAFAELGTFKSWQALIKFGVPHLKSGDTSALHRLIRFSLGLDIWSAMAAFVAAELFLWFGHSLIGLDENYRNLAMTYCLLIIARQRFTAIGT
ncbi:MAG: hypothetical protein AAFV54_15095, partial [Pseudomonadota bacterium]